MNPFTVLIAAAHYGVIFPGIFICIVPVADWISIPLRKLFSVLIPVFSLPTDTSSHAPSLNCIPPI